MVLRVSELENRQLRNAGVASAAKRNPRSRRQASADSDEQLRQDAALAAFVGPDRPSFRTEALQQLWAHRHAPRAIS